MQKFQLFGSLIDSDPCSCTGSQLAAVAELCATAGNIAGCLWYAAGVEVLGPDQDRLRPYNTDAARLVGDTAQSIGLVQSCLHQFLWGVFIAMIELSPPEILAWGIDVEGEDVIQAPESEVEIRTFGTTFIEVITRNDRIAFALANRFKAC